MSKSSNTSRGFITALLTEKDFNKVTEEHITPYFFTGIDRKATTFIYDHYKSYGKVPSIMNFKRRFPDFKFHKVDDVIGTEEPLAFWCDEVRRIKKHNTLAEAVSKSSEMLTEQDTESALTVLAGAILKIQNTIKKPENMKLQDVEQRKKKYLDSQKCGGVTGLRTGLDEFDELVGGLPKGTLTAIMGYTGMGKSWMLFLIGVLMAKAGYKVLIGTTEMSIDMVFRRVDAIWNEFSYSRFKKGKLTAKEQKKYFNYLDSMETSDKFLVVEQIEGGVSQLSAKIEQHDPDIILLDGAYLLEDEEGGEDNHAGVLRVFNGLHKISLSTDKPIVATTQSKDEMGTSLKSLNFARALATACDNVIALEQDKQMKYDREIFVKPLKLREGDSLYKLCMKWDFDEMDFSTLYTSDGGDELEKDEGAPKGGIIINA